MTATRATRRTSRGDDVKTEARLFLGVAAFLWITALGYGIWSSKTQHHVEVVGVAALILSGGLLGIPGAFFWFVSRRIDPRPWRPRSEHVENECDSTAATVTPPR